MIDFRFRYPKGGYLYYDSEEAAVYLSVTNTGLDSEQVRLTAELTDYNGLFMGTQEQKIAVQPGQETDIAFVFRPDKLGYFQAAIRAETSRGETVAREAGFGVTTPHERAPWEDSYFGISANHWEPEVFVPMMAKLGVRYLRNPGKPTAVNHKELLKQYGMASTVQIQGKNILTEERYAPFYRNSAYYYEQQMGDVVKITEHGNEHWEERDLSLLSEWYKSSGLARLKANPSGWYTNSGEPGVDLHKLKVVYEQGALDYITSLSIHAYSFPLAPEQPASYWSVRRLEDLGRFMAERDLHLPVCCLEQGYPAMKNQVKCESYSPGDLVSMEGQVDYLVRSWLMFISYGVSKVVWYNGPWNDGFAFMDEDGPKPWPSVMALAELIRAVDFSTYLGDYEADKGTYFKVFRKKDGSLFGVVWKPVYLSRSCEKEKNFTLDGTATQADGTAQEWFAYRLHHIRPDYIVKDVMGNPLAAENETIWIGERPIYVYNLTEDILPELTDKTIFTTKKVIPGPLPCEILLGINDANPIKRGEFVTSQFMPGETRNYKVRVHNFSGEPLRDRLSLELPEPFTASWTEREVEVPAGLSREYIVSITCRTAADCGIYRIHARLAGSGAHPVYQLAGVSSPIRLEPLHKPLAAGDRLELVFEHRSQKAETVELTVSHEEFRLEPRRRTIAFQGRETQRLSFEVAECPAVFEPELKISVACEGKRACYETVLPLHYIEYAAHANGAVLKDRQPMVLTGYDLLMTPGNDYNGPSLIGNAEPAPMTAYGRMEMDDEFLYCHFDILDDTVVCVKNMRRNNIDSDGVWIRIYQDMQDTKPLRHFCIMPADQTGNPQGCSVKEVSANILFQSPYTDYDFSRIEVSSAIFEDRYTLNVKIGLDSLGLSEPPQTLVADIRVLNMDHDDWTKMYDTGKIPYTVVR